MLKMGEAGLLCCSPEQVRLQPQLAPAEWKRLGILETVGGNVNQGPVANQILLYTLFDLLHDWLVLKYAVYRLQGPKLVADATDCCRGGF